MEKSRIIQGLMRTENKSENDIYEIIKYDLDHGIYFFDTADIYERGVSEIKIGHVLKGHPELREKMFIQTKGSIRFCESTGYYDSSYEYIKKAVNDSLERLGLDYVDSYLLHRPDIFLDAKEVALAFNELYEEGKVKHFGVSNYPKEIIEYLKTEVKQEIEFNQVQLGVGNTLLLDEVFNFNTGFPGGVQKTSGTYFYLKQHNIQIQAWSPYIVNFFEGSLFDENKFPEMNKELNRLAEKYHTSKCAIATAFILNLNKDITVVTGSMDIRHIQESLDGEDIILSKEDWYTLYHACGHTLP